MSVIDAAHVVLHGLTVVLPLISKEVLKFDGVAEEYFGLITSLITMHPEKLSSLPMGLFDVLLESLEYGINHYRVGVVRSSFDALASLAQFQAKERKLDAEFGAMKVVELLQFVLQFVIFNAFHSSVIDAAANAILGLIACEQHSLQGLIAHIVNSQEEELIRQRLIVEFNQLMTTNQVKITFDRVNRNKFKKNLHTFVTNVRGFIKLK